MQIQDFVSFQREFFFDGAVQLKWVDTQPEKARLAAQNYVFHGPQFHSSDAKSVQKYTLKDTLTFTRDIIANLYNEQADTAFHLTIAGYGMGKSHLATALAMLLMNYPGPEADLIFENMRAVDEKLTLEIESYLKIENKPYLILVFDGMGNFNLPSELRKKVVQQIQHADLDLTPIDKLSPRFQKAQEFVKRNYQDKQEIFEKAFGFLPPVEKILQHLLERDETTFEQVNEVFATSTGSEIPLEGQDSVQELLVTINEEYCGPGKPFAKMLILFDEFGRFLEYAADHPRLAGDSALQQIYQGVQDTGSNVNFIGFIQYELKTYLHRIRKSGQGEISRYIGRFDAAQKHMLSSNLETIFANLLRKPDLEQVRKFINQNKPYFVHQHQLMKKFLPRFEEFPTWDRFDEFYQKVLLGSWPLDPITVWLLTKDQNIVQNRSAISFIKDKLDDLAENKITDDPKSYLISPADFCAGSMLEEMKAAEESAGGTIVQSFYAVKEKNAGRFERRHINVLAGIVIASKLKTKRHDEEAFQDFLALLSGLTPSETRSTIQELSDDYNVLEWNSKLAQYDILIDSVPRSAFTNFLKTQVKKVSETQALALFQNQGLSLFQEIDVFKTVEPDFAVENNITSKEWVFAVNCVSYGHLPNVLEKSFNSWLSATQPGAEKGQLIHYLIPESVNADAEFEEVQNKYQGLLNGTGEKVAPVLVQMIIDSESLILSGLKKLCVLQDLRQEHREKYRNFFESEKEQVLNEIILNLKAELHRGHRVGVPKNIEAARRLIKLGSQIFEATYPDVAPFPFDGFHTTKGSASKDCHHFTKSILSDLVSINWLRNASTPQQNRFKTVLINEWGLFSEQLELKQRPKNHSLSKIVNHFDELLKLNGEIDLQDMYEKLLKPPYGFNEAAAGLLLSYFLFKELPNKSLIFDKKDISKNDWTEKALPANLRLFDIKVLRKTKAIYISEDIQQEWQEFFSSIELAESHLEIVQLFKQAETLKIKAPLPAELNDKFKLKVVKYLEPSRIALADYQSKFGKWQDDIYMIQEKNRMDDLIHLCDHVEIFLGKMQREGAAWTSKQFEDIENFQTNLLQILTQKYLTWLHDQNFSNKMDFGKRQKYFQVLSEKLNALNLKELMKATKDHVERLRKNLQAIEDQQNLVKDIERFIAVEKVQATTSDVEVNTQFDRIKNFRSLLSKAVLSFDGPQIQAMEKILSKQEEELKIHRKYFQDKMKYLLFDVNFDSFDILQDTLREVDALSAILRDKNNVEDLKRMREQLNLMIHEVNEWAYLTGSVDVLKIKLQERIQIFLETQAQNYDSEDFSWDSEETLLHFKEQLLAKVHAKELRWKSDNLLAESEVFALSISESQQAITRLKEKLPDYLDPETLQDIDHLISLLRDNIDEKTQAENEKRIQNWLDEHTYSHKVIQSWSMQQAKQALNKLSNPPEYIPLSQVDQLQPLIQEIQLHLEDLKEKASQQAAEDWLEQYLPEEFELKIWPLTDLNRSLNKAEDPPVDYPAQFYTTLNTRFPLLRQVIADKMEAERQSKVSDWLKKHAPAENEITRFSSAHCEKHLNQLVNKPDYFNTDDHTRVARLIDALNERKDQAAQEERLDQIKAWKQRHLPAENQSLDSLNASKCKELLALMKNLPDYLREVDYQQVEAIKQKIESRLDALDFQLLLERVQNLNREQKQDLLNALAQELNNSELMSKN